MAIDRTKEAYHLAQNFMFPLCLYREERHLGTDDHTARVGIANVLLNRAINPRAPYAHCNDVLSNILCPAQFTSFSSHDPNISVLPNPFDPIQWPVWEDCVEICWSLQHDPGSLGPDPTLGATHYHSYPDDRKDLWPSWAQDHNFTVKLGPVRFYKLS